MAGTAQTLVCQHSSPTAHLLLQLQVNQSFLHLLLAAQLPLQTFKLLCEQPIGFLHLPTGPEQSRQQPHMSKLSPRDTKPRQPTRGSRLSTGLTSNECSPLAASSAHAPLEAAAAAQTSCSLPQPHPALADTASAPGPVRGKEEKGE